MLSSHTGASWAGCCGLHKDRQTWALPSARLDQEWGRLPVARRVRLPSWDPSAVLGPCAVSGSSESLIQATPGLPVLRKCTENYCRSGFGFWLKLYQHILLFL